MTAQNPGVLGFPPQGTSSMGNTGPWQGGGGSGWDSPPPQESGLDRTLRLIIEGVIIPTAAMTAGALVQRAIFGAPPEMPSFNMPAAPAAPQAQAPVIPEQKPTVQGIGAKAGEAEARARTVDAKRRRKKGRAGTRTIGKPLGAPLTGNSGVQLLGQTKEP